MTPGDLDDRRVGMRWVTRRTGLHRATIARWEKDGRFPRCHYLAGLRCWWLSEILAWETAQTERSLPKGKPGEATA